MYLSEKLIKFSKKKISCEENRGITMVEILFAVAIMASFIGLLTLALVLYLQIAVAGPKHTAAVFLADEGIEAVKSIRGRGWELEIESLENDTPYYLHLSEGGWYATTTEQIIDDTFNREIILREVERDGDGRIAEIGTPDLNTRRVDVSVSWDGLIGQSEVEMSAYITNIFN